MPRYTKTCKICKRPFSEAGICCSSGTNDQNEHVNGRCPKCCHGEDIVPREQWRNFTQGCRVRGIDHPLGRSTAGLVGRFLEYSQNGYARVGFNPKPEWADQTPVVWLVHPETLEEVSDATD